MFSQYLKFVFNGGLIGLIAWALQGQLFHFFGRPDGVAYAAASLLTYAPLILINFAIQRHLIFGLPGSGLRFIVSNVGIMLLVSVMSPLCRYLLTLAWDSSLGDNMGFVLAALVGATPSFLLSRYFVFGPQSKKTSA